MKDCPEAPEPQFHTPRDPETAREPSTIPRYGETDRYIRLFVLFTTTGVIAMIVYQVIAPIGSPLDTIRYTILSMGHIAGMGIIYTIAVALVSKTVRSVSRRLRRLRSTMACERHGTGGPAGSSQLPEAQWGDSPPGPHPSVVFRSSPAIRAMPASLSALS